MTSPSSLLFLLGLESETKFRMAKKMTLCDFPTRVRRFRLIKYFRLYFHVETVNLNQRLFHKLAIKKGNCPRILKKKGKHTARLTLFSTVHIDNKLNKYSSVRHFLKTNSWMFMCSSLVFKSISFSSPQGSSDHHG